MPKEPFEKCKDEYEIDWYKHWVKAQRRIALLEEILKRKDDRIFAVLRDMDPLGVVG